MLYVDNNCNNSAKTLPKKDKAANIAKTTKTAKVAKVTSQQRQPKQPKATKDSKNSKKANKKEPIFCDLLDFDKEYTERTYVQSQKYELKPQ